ncbi:MAG: dTDP-4-dehydrorhamnose 3,5-epimerase [Flavobacteriaceae bacterium]
MLRSFHFQKSEFSQVKLVRVVKGKVLDIVVDLRANSETYGKSISTILSGENNTEVFVPRGFAHGFVVLENDTIFSYKCDNYYHKASES